MSKGERWAIGRRGRRRRPAINTTASYYDDFYGFGDTTLASRLPLLRPRSSTQTWTLAASATMVLSDGHLEGRFAGQNNATCYMDYGTDSAEVWLDFEFPSTGTNRSVSAMLRLLDTSNFWMAQCHMDQATARIVQVIANANNNRTNGTYTWLANTRYSVRLSATASAFSATYYSVDSQGVRTPLTLLTGNNPATHSAVTPDTGRNLHGIRTSNTQGQGATRIYKFEGTPEPAPFDSVVTVAGVSLGTSKMVPGVSHVQNPASWREAGWPNAKIALDAAIAIHNLHIHPFGLTDPWKLDSPTTWVPTNAANVPSPLLPNHLLDVGETGFQTALTRIREINASDPIIMTCYGAPWWMKGRLQSNGQTIPCIYPDDISTDEGRVMTRYLPYWQILVREAAKIAMASPFNVRIFQVWNELKGFYKDRFNTAHKWATDYYAGTTGLNADCGYTWFYKVTLDGLAEAAAYHGLAASDYKVAGPYALVRSQGVINADSVPSTGYSTLRNRVWGTMDKRGIKGIEEFHDLVIANSLKYDYLCFDFGPGNNDGTYPTTDQWDIRTKYDDLFAWVAQEKTRINLPNLPVIGSEVYAGLGGGADHNTAPAGQITAVKTDTYVRLLKAGITYPLAWGPEYTADDTTNTDAYIINETSTISGGTIAPWGTVNSYFTNHFGPGTVLYEVSSDDDNIDGIASDTKIIAWNKTSVTQSVNVEGVRVSFNAYEVKEITR